ncbi:hypothetical protein MGA5115_00113 [Marinomonas gallaica]|uniref:Uncharacterized protein n=1 Tax=Marinomonas gallaica TaxID=1806667 RepID=A0A1C3JLN7_9GAMM|nr:hypothetical protein [Marinomonas gallaica]SBT16039.1 hypothetical protein MGA5115_00113 [Marinomonas gallaica]SBT21087.1 hypothetical protein MGA5116_01674 [Marinomonas gallaica]
MTEENLFRKAVDADETEMFFKGQGRYFVRDPDWGEHVYAAHYSGWVSDFVADSHTKKELFISLFDKFVSNLKATDEDLEHFFGNLSAIAFNQYKGNFDLGFDASSLKSTSVDSFLHLLKSTDIYERKKSLIDRYIYQMKKWGLELPVDFES